MAQSFRKNSPRPDQAIQHYPGVPEDLAERTVIQSKRLRKNWRKRQSKVNQGVGQGSGPAVVSHQNRAVPNPHPRVALQTVAVVSSARAAVAYALTGLRLRGLFLGLIITLAAVVACSGYITWQISGLRELQNNLVDRNP